MESPTHTSMMSERAKAVRPVKTQNMKGATTSCHEGHMHPPVAVKGTHTRTPARTRTRT